MYEEVKMTRAQRRAIERLQKRVDKAVAADRRFFERFPDREHRLRHAYSSEIAQEEIAQGEPIVTLPGNAAFVIVKCLCSGTRMRLLLQGPKDTEVDLSEQEARAIFEGMAERIPQIRESEAELRAISCGEPIT